MKYTDCLMVMLIEEHELICHVDLHLEATYFNIK